MYLFKKIVDVRITRLPTEYRRYETHIYSSLSRQVKLGLNLNVRFDYAQNGT